MKIRIKILLALSAMLSLGSCQKYNQVDNSSTVKTPYVLFIGGYNGTLHKTNEGLYFNTLFPTDNSCVRQVLVVDSNVLYLKLNLYTSKDEGRSFKISNNHARGYEDLFYKYYLPNQMIYDKSDPNNKVVYFCSATGLELSSDLGVTFTPVPAASYDTPPLVTDTPTSITQLDNGTAYIMIDSANQYRKFVGAGWVKVPQDGVNDLPTDTTRWYISHSHDTLFAVDFNGPAGVRYSTNNGLDWAPVPGLPKKRKLLFANQAYGSEALYVGLDSGGLYRVNATSFTSTGAGMPWSAKVNFVEGKRVVYRTDVSRYYLFCSTDQGLYMSETNGLDWNLIRTGSYSTLE